MQARSPEQPGSERRASRSTSSGAVTAASSPSALSLSLNALRARTSSAMNRAFHGVGHLGDRQVIEVTQGERCAMLAGPPATATCCDRCSRGRDHQLRRACVPHAQARRQWSTSSCRAMPISQATDSGGELPDRTASTAARNVSAVRSSASAAGAGHEYTCTERRHTARASRDRSVCLDAHIISVAHQSPRLRRPAPIFSPVGWAARACSRAYARPSVGRLRAAWQASRGREDAGHETRTHWPPCARHGRR